MKDIKMEDYLQFINEPKHLVNPIRDIRLFDTGFIEFFSSTPWWVIPLAYAPFMAIGFSWSFPFLSGPMMVLTILFGMLFWTFAEYYVHRFLFHASETWLP